MIASANYAIVIPDTAFVAGGWVLCERDDDDIDENDAMLQRLLKCRTDWTCLVQ